MSKARSSAQTRARAGSRVASTPTPARTELRVGISGWRYAGWRGKFYPTDLPQHRELEFAGCTFNSVEINGSFYSLQLPSSYRRWYDATPPDFLFAVKGGRFITHMKKLRDVEVPLANFFASGILALQEKLGPILWQLPPSLGFDPQRLRGFLELLPCNTNEARAFAKIDISRPLRHAMEVRHPTFMDPEFFELLRKYNVAFVIADTAGNFPTPRI